MRVCSSGAEDIQSIECTDDGVVVDVHVHIRGFVDESGRSNGGQGDCAVVQAGAAGTPTVENSAVDARHGVWWKGGTAQSCEA